MNKDLESLHNDFSVYKMLQRDHSSLHYVHPNLLRAVLMTGKDIKETI